MNAIVTKFNRDKGLEVVLYIAHRLSELGQQPGRHKIAKICYFADKDHLSNFGRLITGDQYIAMRNGPVPSGTYDLMKKNPFGGYDVFTKDAFTVRDTFVVEPIRAPNIDVLSESERSSLEHAIHAYGAKNFIELTQESHDKAWEKADENDCIDLLDIVDTLPDSDSLKEHLLS